MFSSPSRIALAVSMFMAPWAAGSPACEERLNLIFEALMAYREDKSEFPTELGKLVPYFLADPSVLLCPTALDRGENNHGRDQFIDASGATSTYAYELANLGFSSDRGNPVTLREFKVRQREAMGDVVPLVRCFRHDPAVALNLPFNGQCYQSKPYWERSFLHIRSFPYTQAPLLFRYPGPFHRHVPLRLIEDASSLDLGEYFNALLGDAWLGRSSPSPLKKLEPGVVTSQGVRFDVRAVMQLQGEGLDSRSFPGEMRIRGPIKFDRLHVLHACVGQDQPARTVATYSLLWEARKPTLCAIRYGEEIASSSDASRSLSAESTIVWRDKTASNCLFHWSIPNPHPGEPLAGLTLKAEQTKAAPFVLAISTSHE